MSLVSTPIKLKHKSTFSFIGASLILFLPFLCHANNAAAAVENAVAKTAENVVPAPNPRLAIIERIYNAAQKKMSTSSDPIGLVLSAKYVRDASDVSESDAATTEKKDSKKEETRKNNLQGAMLARAQQLVVAEVARDAPNSINSQLTKTRHLIDFQIAMFCIGVPEHPVCASTLDSGDAVRVYAESDQTNATGWIILATRDFVANEPAAVNDNLKKVAKAKTIDWFYAEALSTALKFTRDVNDAEAKIGDVEAAAFSLADNITLPPYKRLSQLCMPPAGALLPDGRQQLCRQTAQLMARQGTTNLDLLVSYKLQERLAIAEKKSANAKTAAANHQATQGRIDLLWKQKLTFPPVNDADGVALAAYVMDLTRFGEVTATRMALKRVQAKPLMKPLISAANAK